jgi:hypothetical protein
MSASVVRKTCGALFAALLTCRPTDAAVDATAVPRWFDHTPLSLAWTADAVADSLPPDVGALAADDSLVYVMGRDAGDVLAFDARSGRRRWHWRPLPGNGSARGAPAPAVALSTSPHGVIVGRQDGRALVELDRSGRTVGLIAIRPREFLFGACALGDHGALIATARSSAPWRIVDVGGRSRGVRPPWPDSGTRPAVAWQGALAALPGHTACAVALSVGSGFAVVGADAVASPMSYVERVPVAHTSDHRVRLGARSGVARKLDVPSIAATGAAVRGDTLLVAFVGASPDRGRLVDRYLWRSGRYAGSVRLPERALRIAVSGHRLVVLDDAGAGPSLRVYSPCGACRAVAAARAPPRPSTVALSERRP